jgi:hypothetical protein
MTEPTIHVQTSTELTAENTAIQNEAGNSADSSKKRYVYEHCYALADKDSFLIFRVRSDIVAYFGIKQALTSPPSKLYQPHIGPAAKAKKPKKPRGKRLSVLSATGSPLPTGKKIIVPTNKDKPTEKQINGKPLKHYIFRVPTAMSFDALVIWINNQWKTNQPSFFKTASGVRYTVAKDFKDASKLRPIGDKS